MFFKTGSLLAATAVAAVSASAPVSEALHERFPVLSCTLATTQQSCHSSYPIAANSSASCCYNAALVPGGEESGLVLSTQFYDTNNTSINPGPAGTTTVHGIWPDYCSGRYPQYCTADSGIPEFTGPEIRAIVGKYDAELLKYMDTYWTSYNNDPSDLWSHEFNKHGTCFSTLRLPCQNIRVPGQTREEATVLGYVREAVRRFRQLPTLKWLAQAEIVPSDTVLYNLTDVLAVLEKKSGAVPYVGCAKGTARISEFWYYSYVNGPLVNAVYHPTDTTFNSTCPTLVSLPVKYNTTALVSA
ncbi:unnamed protein product [Tilletia controversa]|uniref:ribonuclease T2 n=3 Tax=Tilletia TaxID=13289 RepID=A0A8X7SV66_9BASI|nr:hypothetical protein CF328_g7993 [Tilletia controversa]KAE8186435.1 hypothetical protein CF336_g6991 [Tilletia laevis]KAE8252123.1 hypothetical protein A4X03_0g6249 [Tilletia caries]KAE8190723.1 hypothetical protein CF335_g6285 [Tilletia laevis]KAE8243962.1 hypothetical protein A4X06_0g6034 [Tilletia controversa]